MNNPVEQLVSVLEKELDMHRSLIAAAREMNDAVKAGAIDRIQAAAHRYDCCITAIADMEEKRLELSDAICRDSPGTFPHASLLRVINSAPAEWKHIIAGLRGQLKAEINDLSKINYANQVLLTESLHSIQKTFDLITAARGARLGGYGYKNQGKKAEPRNTMTIVNTTA